MNKYQEALNEMYAVLNDSERWHKHKEVLQELVIKETPMKPKIVKLFGDLVPTCPANNCVVGLSKYCGNCGQKLDWSDGE